MGDRGGMQKCEESWGAKRSQEKERKKNNGGGKRRRAEKNVRDEDALRLKNGRKEGTKGKNGERN